MTSLRPKAGALIGLLVLPACLGPLVSDEVVTPSKVLPPGAAVPPVESVPALAAQIDENDGVGDLVPRVGAFAHGERVTYWDFGPAPAQAIPILVLAGEGEDGELAPLGVQPNVIDAVPGDPGYSPFWSVVLVPVTAAWKGEVFASFEAIEEGRASGLLGEPAAMPAYANCPVVDRNVRLEVGGGVDPLPPKPVYYRGLEAVYYDFGMLPLASADDLAVPTRDVYLLRREGGEPLSETHRGVDMTGDGDVNDTNCVFEVGLEDPDYTPLWDVVEVVVPSTYQSIDSFQDETKADFRSVADLFQDGVPIPGNVVAVSDLALRVNCPIQSAEGGL